MPSRLRPVGWLFFALLPAALVVVGACVQPPAAPTNLAVSAASTTSLQASWTDNSSNEDGFDVRWLPEGACPSCWTVVRIAANSTSYTIDGLGEGTGAQVQVRAVRCGTPPACSNGAASSYTPAVTQYTLLATPGAVVAADRPAAAGVDVSWTDASGQETEFRIERRGSHETSFTAVASVPAGATSFADVPRWEGPSWVEGALDWARYEYRVTARRLSGGGAVLTASAAGEASVETAWGDTSLDWCAPLLIRPDQFFPPGTSYPNQCVPVWTVAQVAQSQARYALVGTDDVVSPAFTPLNSGCSGVAFPYDEDEDGVPFGATHADLGGYVRAIKDQRATLGGPPIEFFHQHRFDLLTPPLAAQPQFDADYLLRTQTPYQDVLDFYTQDPTPACDPDGAGPQPSTCAFHDEAQLLTQPSYDYYDDKRLRDFLDASGGSGNHQSAVYYIARAGSGTTWHWPVAVIADQRIPAYRSWRVAEALAAHPVGSWDFVELNNKFHQYRNGSGSQPHWLGGSLFPDVAAVIATGDTPWSAQPSGYALAEYVEGWRDLAYDLDAAGPPFSVNVSPFVFRPGTYYDDPNTTVDERELIREGALKADLILLARQQGSVIDAGEFRDIVEDIRIAIAPHGGRVVVYDGVGGRAGPNTGPTCPYQGG